MAAVDQFNLIDEPWIPVLYLDGSFRRVGIGKTLSDAHRIRQIAASNPIDNVALLRLLLAVILWCKPSHDKRAFLGLDANGSIPAEWLCKLREYHWSFDLLSEEGGWYQDPATGGNEVAATNLLHDLPSASNIAHFRHTADGRDGLCLACCALGLARWPMLAPAGLAGSGQSMTASPNGNTPAYVLRVGAGLLATLLAAVPTGPPVEGDRPRWDGGCENAPLGPLKGLTWQSRRVLIAPPVGDRQLESGECSYCGVATSTLVRAIRFRPGWQRPNEKKPWVEDPHLLQVEREAGKGGAATPVVPSWPGPADALEHAAVLWQDSVEGLWPRVAGDPATPATFEITLVAASQSLYKHAATHRTSLPELTDESRQLLATELRWLKGACWRTVAARTGKQWSKAATGHSVVSALRRSGSQAHDLRAALCSRRMLLEAELETAFLTFAKVITQAHAAEARELATSAWRQEVRSALARSVECSVADTTSGSLLRRRDVLRRGRDTVEKALADVDPSLPKGGQP